MRADLAGNSKYNNKSTLNWLDPLAAFNTLALEGFF